MRELVELVRCPKCHGRLTAAASDTKLACSSCRVAYPIVDDIPVLLIEEARPLEAAT